jgi:hypothetical protein
MHLGSKSSIIEVAVTLNYQTVECLIILISQFSRLSTDNYADVTIKL